MLRPSPLAALLPLALMTGMALLAWGPVSLAASSTPEKVESKQDATARQRHLQTLQLYGRYQDERLQRYVEEVGQRVAAASDHETVWSTQKSLMHNAGLGGQLSPGYGL